MILYNSYLITFTLTTVLLHEDSKHGTVLILIGEHIDEFEHLYSLNLIGRLFAFGSSDFVPLRIFPFPHQTYVVW